MDPRPKMNQSITPENYKRYHCYLRVAGVSSAQERESLITSSLNHGIDPLNALHENLLKNQRKNYAPLQPSPQEAQMRPAPFQFFWEKREPEAAMLQAPRRSFISENFFAGIRGWILSTVRTR